MNKVLILHGNNTYNYGTFMMLINYIYYSNKFSKSHVEYYIPMTSDIDFNRLKKELPGDIKINRFIYKKQNKSSNFIEKLLGLKYKLFDQIRQIKIEKINKVVVLGGDDLSELSKKWLVFTQLLLLLKLSKITKLELLGQTVGPFYSWRKLLAKKLFNNSSLVLRDGLSAVYLKEELKFSNFKISNDLAFLQLPFEHNREYIMDNYQLQENNYISIIPSGLYKQYSDNFNDYVNNWVNIVNSILEIKELEGFDLVFFGHVLKPEHVDDRSVILEIQDKIRSNRCKYILDEMLPTEARTILKNGFFTITGRMHPAISTFASNKLAISLSYSIKYRGVIGMQLEMPELVLEKNNNWKGGTINNSIKEILIDLIKTNKIRTFDISLKLEKIRKNIVDVLFINIK